jgi:hypothetical protein
MERWRRTVRNGLIAVAGLVLMATAVPQVASGIGLTALASRLSSLTSCSGSSGSDASSGSSGSSCCSGSSGSSTSGAGGCATGPGTVTGTVAVTGAPAGSSFPYVGAGACPYTGPASLTALCPDPIYSLAGNGTYTLSLDPGTWVVDGFYEVNPFGGAFLSTPDVVTVGPGGTTVLDLTVPYVPPAKLSAKIKVTGLPAGVTVQDVTLLLCPAGTQYAGGARPLACVDGGSYGDTTGPATGAFIMSGLPSGRWTAYPGYCTEFGCATNPNRGVSVDLTAGKTSKVRLSTGYLVPPQGLVNATVTITGAPAGFTAAVGVTACQVQSYTTECQGYGGPPDGSVLPLQLTSGTWEITGQYFAPVFGNPIDGPTEVVDVQGGQVVNLALAVPYQVLGTATGSLRITGKPSGVKITSYTVTACPAGTSGPFGFLTCVSEYSGPGVVTYGAADTRRLGRHAQRLSVHLGTAVRGNSYDLPTLTAGQWDLSVEYRTAFGSFYEQSQTPVTIAAGQTTTTKLTVPYQAPALGAVVGKVSVVGAPAFGFQAGTRACSSAPVAGSCTNEVDAFLGANSSYQLDLPPGTWWVQGVVYAYGLTSTQTVTSEPRQVTITAGAKLKENFTVPVG